MPELDPQLLLEHATLLGLITREQASEASSDAEDGSLEAIVRSLLRKGLMTSWQIDRLQKGDPSGFFFGGCKVLFHLAEGTFARVYRGAAALGQPAGRRQGAPPAGSSPTRRRRSASTRRPRPGMRLRHPNIVQILDYGEQDKQLLHDHGVRRGVEPPRLPQDPRAASTQRRRSR